MRGMVIEYGVLEMLTDRLKTYVENPLIRFLPADERGHEIIHLQKPLIQLTAYRKVIGERIITINGKEYRYAREGY